MNDSPIYISKRTLKSLGQEYRIYRDRVELQCWILLHTIVIPASEIGKIEVRPSAASLRGITSWGLKIDLCDSCRHALLKRKSGIMKPIAFSPDDVEKFVAVCQSIIPEIA